MRALIQLRPSADLIAAVADPAVSVAPADVAGDLPGFDLDHDFAPLSVPDTVAADRAGAGSVVAGGMPEGTSSICRLPLSGRARPFWNCAQISTRRTRPNWSAVSWPLAPGT